MNSFCITCMGRTADLRVTLLRNIEDSREVSDVEWVVLNYNSPDDLDDFARRELQPWIESGVVSYLKTEEPRFYSMAHSRNVAFLAARGEFVHNLDADNFTGRGWAAFIQQQTARYPERSIFARRRRSFHGRIGLRKTDFIALGGYDESFDGYGYDDRDLLERALAAGLRLRKWGWRNFGRRIETPAPCKVMNLRNPDWQATERQNREKSEANLARGLWVANRATGFGRAELVRNFTERLVVGIPACEGGCRGS